MQDLRQQRSSNRSSDSEYGCSRTPLQCSYSPNGSSNRSSTDTYRQVALHALLWAGRERLANAEHFDPSCPVRTLSQSLSHDVTSASGQRLLSRVVVHERCRSNAICTTIPCWPGRHAPRRDHCHLGSCTTRRGSNRRGTGCNMPCASAHIPLRLRLGVQAAAIRTQPADRSVASAPHWCVLRTIVHTLSNRVQLWRS